MLSPTMLSENRQMASSIASDGGKRPRRCSLPDSATPSQKSLRRGSLFITARNSRLSPEAEEKSSNFHSADKSSSRDLFLRAHSITGGPNEKKGIRHLLGRLSLKPDSAAALALNSTQVEVHSFSNSPALAWEVLKHSTPVLSVKPMPVDTPVYEDKVRFVCISDTHSRPLDRSFIPPGDVLVVAGDFTTCGHPKEIKAFDEFLGTLPHSYKVVVCGNHELTFDQTWIPAHSLFPGLEKLFQTSDSRVRAVKCVFREALRQENVVNPRQLLTNCIHLEDSMTTLFGLRIYGTPWVPKFDDWAYNVPRGQHILEKWNRIPSGVDVLITHTPPLGFGDLTQAGFRAGCVELLSTVRKRVKPKYHIFGHIHEGRGCATDGYTKFINACVCDTSMKPRHRPIIFDIPLQEDDLKSYYVKV